MAEPFHKSADSTATGQKIIIIIALDLSSQFALKLSADLVLVTPTKRCHVYAPSLANVIFHTLVCQCGTRCLRTHIRLHFRPLSSTWPHLNSDVGLEEEEY